MALKYLATTLSVLILVGCSESYRPAKRDAPAAALKNTPLENAPVENPHGTFKAAAPAEHLGNQVDAAAIQLRAPEQWVRQQPRSGFVMAEFSLPHVEEDEKDGRLTVSVAGGSIEANIDRWRGQFGGNPDKDSQEEMQVAGLTVAIVDFTGTFNEQAGPFAPGVTREGYRMLAAIIPVGEQLHFIKAYGPEKTMARHAAAFDDFVKTVQKK